MTDIVFKNYNYQLDILIKDLNVQGFFLLMVHVFRPFKMVREACVYNNATGLTLHCITINALLDDDTLRVHLTLTSWVQCIVHLRSTF